MKLAPSAHLSASNDLSIINEWEVPAESIVGISCKPSRIVVFDCNAASYETFVQYLSQLGIHRLTCPTVKTPSGGFHHYYSIPEGIKQEIDPALLPKGVELRTDYVIAPECMLPDGRSYELINGSLDSIPPLPFTLRDALVSTPKNFEATGSKTCWHRESRRIERKQLAKGLLPRSGVGLIAGQSGAGKTFVSLFLAACAATGHPFFGSKIDEAVGTLLVLSEGVDTIAERLEAIMQSEPIALADTHLDRLPIAWYPLPKTLSEQGDRSALILELKHVNEVFQTRHDMPLGIIIVDTLAAAFLTDENDATAATDAMQYLQRISVETNALVLAVTHYGKSAEAGVRGSSAYTASADVILAVHAEKNAKGEVFSRAIHLVKSRWRETGWNSPFTLTSVPIGTDEDGEVVSSGYVSTELRSSHKEPTKKRPTNALNTLLRAFDSTISANGEHICLRPHTDAIIAVRREVLRREFNNNYPADGDTEARRADNKRKQFKRAFDAAASEGILAFEHLDGADWVWRPD